MGFNFQAGHPHDVYETGHADRVIAILRSSIGPAVPLGRKGEVFLLRDEMGWSWWSLLKQHAVETLGPQACPQILATDAANAVYIDADLDRQVLWPDGQKENIGRVSEPTFHGKTTLKSRLRALVGLKAKPAVPADVMDAMRQMMNDFGPRAGEHGALQVASLPRLIGELNTLLRSLHVEPAREDVQALLNGYAEDDARVDDDPAVQCLCHAWLTANHASTNNSPMWLIK